MSYTIHRHHRVADPTRRLTRPARLVGLTAAAAAILSGSLLFAAEPASAATTAVATSSTTRMTYTGTDVVNKPYITVTGPTTARRFVIDDIVPITAGAGCVPVAGDVTKVTCAAPTSGPSLRPFTVRLGGGSDIVTNATGVPSVAASANMTAFGGPGDDLLTGSNDARDILHGEAGRDHLRGFGGADELRGGSTSESDRLEGGDGTDDLFGGPGNDTLLGGNGNNDDLDGGTGADHLDGGNGIGDAVFYDDRTAPVQVFLKPGNGLNNASTGNGEQNENDTIAQIETAIGGDGSDGLSGNDLNNTLLGGPGDDVLFGGRGEDNLIGGDGKDLLIANTILDGPSADGVPDFLDGRAGTDTAVSVAAEGDIVVSCEIQF